MISLESETAGNSRSLFLSRDVLTYTGPVAYHLTRQSNDKVGPMRVTANTSAPGAGVFVWLRVPFLVPAPLVVTWQIGRGRSYGR